MKNISFDSGSRQTGFSLVDVMVGMVLSLLGTIIIFQVFEVSERIKRTTTGGGDAQQNGAAALFALERGVRQAGYGINGQTGFIPIVITTGTPANVPDSITVSYLNNWDYGPFASSNILVFGQPPCTTKDTYSIDMNLAQLKLTSQLIPNAVTTACPPSLPTTTVLIEGIAQFKALPLMDATGSTVAMQLAVVARSSQPEKPNPAGQCATTTGPPSWIGGTVDLTGMVGLTGDDWKCYRYKVFEVTVPLRNVLWQ